MKVNKDNYQSVFEKIATLVERIPESENTEIASAKKRIAEELKNQRNGCEDLLRTNDVLRIGVVGQVKAGKSSFLNSLIFNGENVLPRASTPMTAGLTILQYGEENSFDVEYYNTQEWQSFKDKDIEYRKQVEDAKVENPEIPEAELSIDEVLKAAHELVLKCDKKAEACVQKEAKHDIRPFHDIVELQDVLEDYVGANGTYTSIVKSLTINLHDERLGGVQIIDTPGVNDPVVSREQRTRECLRGCHGVFLLSYSGQFFDAIDVSFLINRIGEQSIAKVIMIASKFDSVLQQVDDKYHDDFIGAIKHCQATLKEQMERNLASSVYRGDRPELDYSSGIGFSIAHKKESSLDEMERHIIKQMKRCFPSNFTDKEECKQNFNMLSSIDDIREKYLEKTFKDNKDKIIAQKVDNYFAESANNIRKIVSSRLERLQQMLNALNENDIKDLKHQREVYLDIVDNINNDIESVVKRAEQRAEQAQKKALNAFSFNINRVPSISKTASCNRKSTFWGRNKSFSVDFEVVDINKLATTLEDGFRKEIEKISSLWEKESAEIVQLIKDTINNIISDRESADDEGKLNARLLRNLLYETIDSMENDKTLDFYAIRNEFNNALSSCLQSQGYVPTSFGSMEEYEAREIVQESARKIKKEIQCSVSELVQSTRTEVQKVVKKGRENSLDVLTNNKDQFINTFKESITKYIDELEENLENKEHSIAILNEAITPLKELEDTLK